MNPVMCMALGQALLIPDVVGVEATDDHLLEFTYGIKRLVGTQGGEIGAGDEEG